MKQLLVIFNFVFLSTILFGCSQPSEQTTTVPSLEDRLGDSINYVSGLSDAFNSSVTLALDTGSVYTVIIKD